MRKLWKWLILAVVLLWIAGVAVVAGLRLKLPPDLTSSPLSLRNGAEYRSGYLGVLEPDRQSASDDFPADTPFQEPVLIPGDVATEFLLDWEGEPEFRKKPQPNRWVPSLLGDDQVELAAFATWVPAAEDDVSSHASWDVDLSFRDAASADELSTDRLDEWDVPASFRKMIPGTEYRTPKIRLLLRVSNKDHFRIVGGSGGDTRTGSVVTYDLDRLSDTPPFFGHEGEWAYYDMALLVWHDIPMKFFLQVLTGEPQEVELPQKLGAQVAFGDALRIQWLDARADDFDLGSYLGNFEPAASIKGKQLDSLNKRIESAYGNSPSLAYFEIETVDPGDPPTTLVRANSSDYLTDHCGWIPPGETKPRWTWDRMSESGQMLFASIPGRPKAKAPMKLVFVPHVTELTFEIPGLPDQPNPGDVEDLFDITIPRITLPDDPDSAEDHLLGLSSVAAEIEFSIDNEWDEWPDDMPADRTFRNQSPRELLLWYLKATPGSRIRFDESEHLIFFNEEKDSWWARVVEWWEAQGWFF